MNDYIANYFNLRCYTLIAQMDFQALNILVNRYSHNNFKISDTIKPYAEQFNEILTAYSDLDLKTTTFLATTAFLCLTGDFKNFENLLKANYEQNLCKKIVDMYNVISLKNFGHHFLCE